MSLSPRSSPPKLHLGNLEIQDFDDAASTASSYDAEFAERMMRYNEHNGELRESSNEPDRIGHENQDAQNVTSNSASPDEVRMSTLTPDGICRSRAGLTNPAFDSVSQTQRKRARAKAAIADQMLVELFDLDTDGIGASAQPWWRPTARWIKYEEHAKGVDQRFGLPRLPFLAYDSLKLVRRCVHSGLQGGNMFFVNVFWFTEWSKRVLLLDVLAGSLGSLVDQIINALKEQYDLSDERCRALVESFNLQHSFGGTTIHRTDVGENGRSRSAQLKSKLSECVNLATPFGLRLRSHGEMAKRLADNTEVTQVFAGSLSGLDKPHFVMVRLSHAVRLYEHSLPIRFVFLLLTPDDGDFHELGRSIATLMANRQFHAIAYRANVREDLLAAMDEFLDHSIVLPPGEIESAKVLSPRDMMRALHRQAAKARRSGRMSVVDIGDVPLERKKRRNPLQRSSHFLGGLIGDVRDRLPHYGTDFTDALCFQAFVSSLFMFIATLAPAVIFGAVLGENTGKKMGVREMLIAQSLCGVVSALFSAQPMIILCAAGPMLIFELSLIRICASYGIPLLLTRMWASVFVLVYGAVAIVAELAFLLRFITPFTEEIFDVLISSMFISYAVDFITTVLQRKDLLDKWDVYNNNKNSNKNLI